MSFEAMSIVAKTQTKTPITKLVLFMLANYSNEDFESYPSQSKLAELCSCDARTVKRALQSLEQENLIKVIHRFTDNGRQTSNAYRIIIGGDKKDRGRVTNMTLTGMSDMPPNTITNKQSQYTDEFNQWWSLYPKKAGSKKRAYGLFCEAVKKYGFDKLIIKTEIYRELRKNEDDKYTPMPTTWLNQEYYETVEPPKPKVISKNQLAG